MTVAVKRIAQVDLNLSNAAHAQKFLVNCVKLAAIGNSSSADSCCLGSRTEELSSAVISLVEGQQPLTQTTECSIRANAVGFSRLAIKVPDIDYTYAAALAAGLTVFDEPVIEDNSDEHFFCVRSQEGSVYQFVEGLGDSELWFVNLNCTDLQRSMDWYQCHFGFEAVTDVWQQEHSGRAYDIAGKIKLNTVRMQLPFCNAECGLQLQQWTQPVSQGSAPQRSGANAGFSSIVLEVESVAAKCQALEEAGISCVFEQPESNQAYCYDPDGACIVLRSISEN